MIWLDGATTDIADIVAYVKQDSPLAAERLAKRIRHAGEGLDIFPDRGRAIAGGLRELTTVHPYLIRYRHDPISTVVQIVQVRHGARRPDR